MTTVTRTETISVRKGMATVTVSVADGALTKGDLAIDAHTFGGNRLFIKDLYQLKDVISAAQELLEIVTRMIRHE